MAYLGRCDQQLKINGVRIEPEEVARFLARQDLVRQAAVVAFGQKEGARLAAFLVPRGPGLEADDLRRRLRPHFPEVMIPTRFLFLEELPLNKNGKIDHRALSIRLEAGEGQLARPAYQPPRNEVEADLAEIWGKVLQIPQVGMDDDFFALGGNSLQVTRMLLQAKERLQVNIPLERLFQMRTIAQFAKAIEMARQGLIEEVENPDWSREVRLLSEIGRKQAATQQPGWNQLLLTGATGFLGAFLLKRLLQEGQSIIHCLVRVPEGGEPMQRLEDSLARFSLSLSEQEKARLRVFRGDLGQPFWGLEPPSFTGLAAEIEQVIHCGAQVNFMLPYASLRAANVQGTHECLRFCSQGRHKQLHFISTISLFAPSLHNVLAAPNEDALPEAEYSDGYRVSKWVGERMVAEARSRHLSARIYRIGRVGPDSGSGAASPDDLFQRLLVGGIQLGSLPKGNIGVWDLAPVDFVADAIFRLAQEQGKDFAENFHLFHPQRVSWNLLHRAIQRQGYDLRQLKVKDWLADLQEKLPHDEQNPMAPLAGLLVDGMNAGKTGFNRVQQKRTLKLLSSLGFTWPKVTEEMIEKNLKHLQCQGKLLPPQKNL